MNSPDPVMPTPVTSTFTASDSWLVEAMPPLIINLSPSEEINIPSPGFPILKTFS